MKKLCVKPRPKGDARSQLGERLIPPRNSMPKLDLDQAPSLSAWVLSTIRPQDPTGSLEIYLCPRRMLPNLLQTPSLDLRVRNLRRDLLLERVLFPSRQLLCCLPVAELDPRPFKFPLRQVLGDMRYLCRYLNGLFLGPRPSHF